MERPSAESGMNGRAAVLVVDDEPRNRNLLRHFLTPAYQVCEAGSGAEALDLVSRGGIDLVLLDVMMPMQDGYSVCRAIKALPEGAFLPVLLVTALSEQDDRNRGLAAGADDFLHKPVDRREILLRVEHFLQLRRQDALIRSQVEALRRLQEQKDDLVSLLVHDLRNPLAGLLSTLELAQDQVRDPGAQDDLKRAVQLAQRLRDFLDETLQVRLLEEGAVVARRAGADLRRLVSECVETAQPVARTRQITVHGVLEGSSSALIDFKLVRRSVENLLSNALKYTARGSTIELRVHEARGAVEVSVADRGPGIPDRLKTALFQRFGSVEAERGGARRGVGLGLYLVKLVAAAHGGQVSVTDRGGGGAIFRLHLPAPAPALLEGAA